MYLKLIEKSNILLYVPRGYVHLNFTNLYAFLFLSGIKKTQHVWSTCFNQPKVKIIEFFYILEFFLIFESCSFICKLTTYLAGYLWLLSLHSAYNNKISWFSCLSKNQIPKWFNTIRRRKLTMYQKKEWVWYGLT